MVWIVMGIVTLVLFGGVMLVVFVMLAKGPLFRRIFADSHFVECAQGARSAARAACRRKGEALSPDEDEMGRDDRVFRSSQGLTLQYAVREGDGEDTGQFVHHYSISLTSGYTPHAIGGTFVVWVARILEVNLSMGWVGVSPKRVHHAEFALDAQEQRQFEEMRCELPSEAEVRHLQAENRALRDSLDWESLED